jgi:hypothetical protein
VSFRVAITPTGQRTVSRLRGKARDSFDAAVTRLAAEGCRAASYRLSGRLVERLCSVSLYGRYRALVCFPDEARVVVLLVGEHRRDDPALDVYRQLYRLLELSEPSAERTKPPCCEDDNEAPVDPELLDRFEAGAKRLRSRSRRRARPRRPAR